MTVRVRATGPVEAGGAGEDAVGVGEEEAEEEEAALRARALRWALIALWARIAPRRAPAACSG